MPQVIGVAQVINKKGGGTDHFSQEDQEVRLFTYGGLWYYN